MKKQNSDKIDPLIADVVSELNRAGHETFSSCQGRTCIEDYEKDRHCEHSFISFTDDNVLKKRRSAAKKLGLDIYNGGISITALTGKESTMEEVFASNLSFSPKMRKLFALPSVRIESEPKRANWRRPSKPPRRRKKKTQS